MARNGNTSAMGAPDYFLGSGVLCGDSGAGGNVCDSPPQSAATAAHRLRNSGPGLMVGWTLPRRTLGGFLTETAPGTSGPPGVFFVDEEFSAALTLKPSQSSPAAARLPLPSDQIGRARVGKECVCLLVRSVLRVNSIR